MEIVGYAKRGSKDMVIFRDDRGVLKSTDGFHDRKADENGAGAMRSVSSKEVDLKKIYRRLYGSRSWHPLVGELKKAMKEME